MITCSIGHANRVLEDGKAGEKTKIEADVLGIYYSDLIPVLIKSIQQQQELIEKLEERIKQLEERK